MKTQQLNRLNEFFSNLPATIEEAAEAVALILTYSMELIGRYGSVNELPITVDGRPREALIFSVRMLMEHCNNLQDAEIAALEVDMKETFKGLDAVFDRLHANLARTLEDLDRKSEAMLMEMAQRVDNFYPASQTRH